MQPHLHFDFTAKNPNWPKTIIRFLFGTAAYLQWNIGHIDVAGASLHEMYPNYRLVFIREHSQINVELKSTP